MVSGSDYFNNTKITWFYFTFKRWFLFFKLNLPTLIENSIEDSDVSLGRIWIKLIPPITEVMRLWCSNYRYMEYRYSSNNIPMTDQSYKVQHTHESQSEGMDRQWFQINIITDIRKRSFLYMISHYIYYYHLNPLIFFGARKWLL